MASAALTRAAFLPITTANSASPSKTEAAMSGSTMVSPSPTIALGTFRNALIGAGSGSVPSSM
jgi:hypothetical protein